MYITNGSLPTQMLPQSHRKYLVAAFVFTLTRNLSITSNKLLFVKRKKRYPQVVVLEINTKTRSNDDENINYFRSIGNQQNKTNSTFTGIQHTFNLMKHIVLLPYWIVRVIRKQIT